MKFALSLIAAAVISAVPTAFAQSTTDISVTGTITPAACRPTFGGVGAVDFGRIASHDLEQGSHTPLPEKTLALTVVCDGPTRFALRSVDNREGSATSPSGAGARAAYRAHGLGMSGEEKIGHYLLDIEPANAQIDGATAYATYTLDLGLTWSNTADAPHPLSPLELVGFSFNSGHTAGPDAVTNLTSALRISAHVAPAQELSLTDEVTLDGSAVIEVVYL
ncbi:DUF1120 domain-containing protein [Pseudomonas sp. LS1212]|uniref:DUF1120 domain-containing protein n=1 Tax=Pseudomonas sp. LS1212 TaxID=2972478 RepID=UPI00215B7FE2|nr:DUF1120 domain-containing protein [Pseudomonas sp. LS1212]UVJ45134.1 DUF1120 domain-containing protein [Pseudomonas sp. LS1212]